MNNVIQMFVTDEITGLQVPNVPSQTEFIVTDEFGRGISIHPTWNEALAKLTSMVEKGCHDDCGIVVM